jgi:CHAT domain-containing protein/Flp pilus assembly protein TadD
MIRLIFVSLFALVSVGSLWAQNDELTKFLNKTVSDFGNKKRASLDSIDFQYAVILNENAGFMDVKEKGGNLIKGLAGVKDEADKTASEKARDQMDEAIGYYRMGWFRFAEIYFLQAKQSYEDNDLTDELNYIKVIANMGLLYNTMGRLTSAEEFTLWALQLSEERLGKNSVAYASCMNNLAVLYQQTGKFTEAEKDIRYTVEITTEALGKESMQYAIVRNNEALIYQKMGRYDEAEKILLEAIDVALKAERNSKSQNNTKFLSNLALLYRQSGKLTQAEKTYVKLIDIKKKRFGTGHPDYATVLNDLATLHIEMGKMGEVEANLKKAADIYKKKFGTESPSYATTQHDLGSFYRMQGKFGEAENALYQALKVRKTALGESHPLYADTKEAVAILHWKKGEAEKAYEVYHEVMEQSIDFINKFFPPMSEQEKTKYWDILWPRFQRFFNFAIESRHQLPQAMEDMMHYHIATKALLLSSTNKIKAAILASSDTELKKSYLMWLDKKETLSRVYSYTQEELKEQKIDLAQLEREANDLERSLSEKSTLFSDGYSVKKISINEISGLLTDKEALVDIVRVKLFDKQFTDEVQYAVLVLEKGKEKPSVAILTNGKELESRYIKFYHNAIRLKMDDAHSYPQFWKEIDLLVGSKSQLYLSLDGVYNQLSPVTLKKPDGKYLVNHHTFTILGNSRDLIQAKKTRTLPKVREAVLVGFPDYGGREVEPLPGTKTEVETVAKVLRTAGVKTQAFLALQATEAQVKEVKKPWLLHIATHGYFLQDVESTGNAFGVNLESASNNPLLRSGLLFSGAAATLTGRQTTDYESNDNGVLTAYEAMNLALDGTDLVVLSACETGKGEIKSGEGVYGLQRAFIVAGANALLMSLWKVDDAATQQLMSTFYTAYAKTGNKQQAFRQAQLALMAKYPEPYYWGAFVMMGN